MTIQQLQNLASKAKFQRIGKAPVVVLPLKQWEKLEKELEDLEMRSSKKLPRDIAQARKDVKYGKGLTMMEVKKRLKL